VATPAEFAAAHFAERLLHVPGSFFINEYAGRCARSPPAPPFAKLSLTSRIPFRP
jgi:hypothetical protein